MKNHLHLLEHILEKATYDQALYLIPDQELWRIPGLPPVDPMVYYDLVHIFDYNEEILRFGLPALEPDEWIGFLNGLVKKNSISSYTRLEALIYGEISAKIDGYTYSSMIVKEELDRLKKYAI